MIQQETQLEVADNTGARRVRCIKVLGSSRRRYAHVGDKIKCSIQVADPHGSVKKGAVVDAIIVRTKGAIPRDDGKLMFYVNSCVIVDDKGEPQGTRIFGPVPREVREKGYIKICSLAPEVI